MTLPELMQRALAMPDACAENPFGPDSICVRIGPHAPIFALFMPKRQWVTFRCDAEQELVWRAAYPDHVRRGYYCPPRQQPYSNTVTLDGSVPDEVLAAMLAHSHERCARKLSKTR